MKKNKTYCNRREGCLQDSGRANQRTVAATQDGPDLQPRSGEQDGARYTVEQIIYEKITDRVTKTHHSKHVSSKLASNPGHLESGVLVTGHEKIGQAELKRRGWILERRHCGRWRSWLLFGGGVCVSVWW